MPLSEREIFECFNNREFERLLGEFESSILECKGQPYDLMREDQKLELAKDISGLANANGGILLIGFATTKSDIHGEDQISLIRPFPAEKFDKQRYQQVLSKWLYPQLDGIEIDVHTSMSGADVQKSLVAIRVPQAIGLNSPVLITKSILLGSSKSEILFGYCVRRQAHVQHYDVERLQALIRDGSRMEAEIRDNFTALHSAIEELRSGRISLPEGPLLADVQASISEAQKAVSLVSAPAFILAAYPTRPLNLRSIFESRDSDTVKFIDRPPEIRFSGFDLNAGGSSKIVEGKLRRSVTLEDKLLEVHRNGLIIYIGSGGPNGLCWGRQARQRESFLINQIALIESVYLFALLVERTYAGIVEAGEEIQMQLHLRNINRGDVLCRLESGPLGDFSGLTAPKTAPNSSVTLSSKIQFKQFPPERVAVFLLSELYTWFGFEEDKIPYTKVAAHGRSVDPEALIALG